MALALLLIGFLGGRRVITPLNWESQSAYAVESGQAQAPPDQLQQAKDLSRGFRHVAKSIRPAVVSISSVRRIVPTAQQRQFGRDVPGGIPERGFEQRGSGSGVVVSEDGYILTNNHVVRAADEVNVTLSDSRTLSAKVIGTDEKTDLAVLKIDTSGLSFAKLGDSDAIDVGEWALAIGSPFGLAQTVTAGIISAKGRSNVGITDYEDFLQTDAAINPGNSGGPLVNLDGQVIGINTAIASRSGGYMGIGFAIPSNLARPVMQSIIKDGHVERGWLGVAIQDLTKDLADSLQLDSRDGVLVGNVIAGSPADEAGLQSGDIILRFGGKPPRTANQLRNAVAATAPDTKTVVAVFRNGQTRTLKVAIGRLENSLKRKQR